MAAKVFEKSAEETAFRAVLKEVYESGKNSVAVLWADAALSARFQETLYAFLLKDVLGSAAAGVKLRTVRFLRRRSGDGADRIHARDVHRSDEPRYKGRKQGHSAP